MDKKKSNSGNSLPNDRQNTADQSAPEPMPPDIKVIECSCALADNRVGDNSKWTNIIKEPIEVAKGSEIRVLSSFVDMRGIDQEIIQFQSKGPQQDNAHTLLTQHYTTNDGYNNKTASYDYLGNGVGEMMDVGQDFDLTGTNPPQYYYPTLTNTTVGGTNCTEMNFRTVLHAIRPKNIAITSAGSNYENGTPFTIAANGGDDFQGKIITDDEGGVVGLHFTKPYSDNAPSNPNTLTFPYTLGSGCVVSLTFTTYGIRPILPSDNAGGTFLDQNRSSLGRGTKFKPAQNITITGRTDENGAGGGNVSPENAAVFQVGNVFIGNGQLNDQTHYDQGYNYEKTPVMRWAQTFNLNTAFAYGGNTGERVFKSHGQEIIIKDEASHQVNDPCLSAGGIIMNKEDEFAPGIYHTENNADDWTINAPVMFFDKDGADTFTLTPQLEDEWELAMPKFAVETNGNPLTANLVNIMPLGSVWQFQFEFKNISATNDQNIIDLHQQLSQFWNTPFRIKSHNPTAGSVRISSSFSPYVGAVSEYIFGTQRSPQGTYPPSTTIEVSTTFNAAEDELGAPTENPKLIFATDANGQLAGAVQRGTSPGAGCRRGMTFSVDYPNATERIFVRQVDQTAGWDFPACREPEGLKNLSLTANTAGADQDVRAFLVPVQNHSAFVKDEFDVLGNSVLQNQGNRIGFRPFNQLSSIGTSFPSTINSGIIQPYTIPEEPAIGYTKYASNGLYRPDGESDSDNVFFNPRNGGLVNHDTDIKLQIQANNNNIQTFSVAYGNSSSATDVIVPYGTTADLFYVNATGGFELRINIENWVATGRTHLDLPLNTYLVLRGNVGGEIAMQTSGLSSITQPYYTIDIVSPDVEFTNITQQFTTDTTQTYLARTSLKLEADIKNPTTNGNNLNAYNNATVEMIYSSDIKNNATQLKCQWKNMTGGMGYTALQNFWNDNDPNKAVMQNQPLYKNNSISSRNTYNRGGYYFLSHMTGYLSTATGGQVLDYDLALTQKNVYNQGFDFWNMAKLPHRFYAWRTDYQPPTPTNLNQSFTSITSLWDYYKLYRQNSFLIDKNFCVASDISGLWTRQAHKLKGAVDMITGGEYVNSKESGILQNEFIMPVYGANNLINNDGTYRKNNTVYADSGGLEPGHCVGMNYLTNGALWLAGDLIASLPTDKDGKTFYYVFFRTPWTTYRGYDPLKDDGAGNPDKTPLDTVSQDAYKIGNANVQDADTKKALDGSTMIATLNTEPPATPPVADNKAFELGTAGGVAPGGASVKFGERGYYPIYYLDRGLRSQYPKAKISQYVGSQNLTLAFATDISTFTFQFLHSPYTSPFVDGQGGTNSVRVFFGNRKAGIFNHETLGGVVVVNYARPDFPSNTFTLTEINNNPTFPGVFQYGIDPLRSVGFVGRQFMNKLGFTDTNIGVVNGQIATDNEELNYKLTPYTRNITSLADTPTDYTYTINSYDTEFYGTTGSDLDSSDSILSEIPAPESNAGLESHNQLINPVVGTSNRPLRKFGDFIYYPYSLNTESNSFNSETALVRFDNASSTYGAIGGMLLSNSNRGMGLPNTVGSTFICDDQTIPKTLNPDCELYLAYTVACGSSLKQASLLPVKLTNAYLLVLSSLMKEANVYMPSAGFVNAMSIINKTFLQGDFILSQGQMSFYAKDTFILSQIETEIKDTAFGSPSTLGVNSSVIYQITNYNPKPKPQLPTIEQMQDQDYEIMRMMNSHLAYLQGQEQTSPLSALQGDLYKIGVQLLHPDKNSVDIISAMRNQINAHDLGNLNPAERAQFMRTPEGQILMQNVGDIQAIHQVMGNVADAQNDVFGEYGGPMGRQNLEATSRTAEREVKARERAIKERTPLQYFQPPPVAPPTPDPQTDAVQDFFGDLASTLPARGTRYTAEERAAQLGERAKARAGYTPEDVAKMEAFAQEMKDREPKSPTKRNIARLTGALQGSVVSPSAPASAPKTGGDDSGFATGEATRQASGAPSGYETREPSPPLPDLPED